jgi:hypothetical protein
MISIDASFDADGSEYELLRVVRISRVPPRPSPVPPYNLQKLLSISPQFRVADAVHHLHFLEAARS